jgi:hypothetical protein
MKVKVYSATFVKMNGESRLMNFIRAEDFTAEFISTYLKTYIPKEKRALNEGLEAVFDVDSKSFKTFNWNTIVGSPTTEEKEV